MWWKKVCFCSYFFSRQSTACPSEAASPISAASSTGGAFRRAGRSDSSRHNTFSSSVRATATATTKPKDVARGKEPMRPRGFLRPPLRR